MNGRLRARKGARLTAITSGGAIPDTGDYQVLLQPEGMVVGTVNEDFAVESLPGNVFQLGNASWRILKVEPGRVLVEDAKGRPPTIPFWLGEAPGRTDELSVAVSRLRGLIADLLKSGGQPLLTIRDLVKVYPVFATALLLILVVTATNLVAISLRNHLRRKYAGSAV